METQESDCWIVYLLSQEYVGTTRALVGVAREMVVVPSTYEVGEVTGYEVTWHLGAGKQTIQRLAAILQWVGNIGR